MLASNHDMNYVQSSTQTSGVNRKIANNLDIGFLLMISIKFTVPFYKWITKLVKKGTSQDKTNSVSKVSYRYCLFYFIYQERFNRFHVPSLQVQSS
jgi:hypothetical protein